MSEKARLWRAVNLTEERRVWLNTLDLSGRRIACKPGEVDGRIEPRKILHLAVMFDHDVIHGASEARFARRLVDLIEGGYGPVEDQGISLMVIDPVAERLVPLPV